MADRSTTLSRSLARLLLLLLPALDLAWNLTHLNIGLVDFHGLAAFARGFAQNAAWPATPYFPAGYPLLLMPFGYLGQLGLGCVLQGGYILSAAGEALALWSVYRLCRYFGLERWAGIVGMLLVWLSPEFRVTAGSPSVDMLFTGLGSWFIAAALCVWNGEQPRWVRLGLCITPAALLLLRYHGAVLVLPVALVLLLRPATRREGLLAICGALAAIALNFGSYYLAWQCPLHSVVAIQVRSGLDFRYHHEYRNADALYDDYPDFVQHVHNSPLLQDYSASEVAKHVLLDWLMFLRRPAVALAMLLVASGWLSGRKLPAEYWLLAAWIAAYALALSPAYYTARSATLPGTLAVVLVLALGSRYARSGQGSRWVGICALLMLGGFALASRFAVADFRERLALSRMNRKVAAWLAENQTEGRDVVTLDGRLIKCTDNPWLVPYQYINTSWMQDPDIAPRQVPDLVRFSLQQLPARLPFCIAYGAHHLAAYKTIAASQSWTELSLGEGRSIFVPKPGH